MTELTILKPNGLAFASPWVDTYVSLATEIIAAVNAALETGRSSILGEDARPEVVQKAARQWRTARGALVSIANGIQQLAADVATVATNPDFTSDARQRKVDDVIAAARTKIAGDVQTAKQSAAQVLDGLRTAAYPARPGRPDAASETAIQGIKADLTMVLAPATNFTTLLARLSDQLTRAIADGDALRAWVLASTHWPEDYLLSRGHELGGEAWAARAAETLNRAAPSDISGVRETYNAVSNPQTGLPVLDSLFGAVVDSVIRDVINEAAPFMRR